MGERDRQVQRVIDVATGLVRPPLAALFAPAWQGAADPFARLTRVLAQILDREEESAAAPAVPPQPQHADSSDLVSGLASGLASGWSAPRVMAHGFDGRPPAAADWAERLERMTAAVEHPIAAARSEVAGAPRPAVPDDGRRAARGPHATTADAGASVARATEQAFRLVETPAALAALLRSNLAPADPATPGRPAQPASIDHRAAPAAQAFAAAATGAAIASAPPGRRAGSDGGDLSARRGMPTTEARTEARAEARAEARHQASSAAPSAPPAPLPSAGPRLLAVAHRGEPRSGDAPAAGPAHRVDERDDRGEPGRADEPAWTALAAVPADRDAAVGASLAGSPLPGLATDGRPGVAVPRDARTGAVDDAIAEELLLDRLLDRLQDRLRELQIRQFGITGGEI